tara:strand:- start:82 stop:396 length:315 start_codon:yes stop_codon:yes gene_type:complete
MTQKIVVLFNLKPDCSVAEYEAWAKAKDIPTVNGLRSVDNFEVLKSVGLIGSDQSSPYNYVEIIDMNDMEGFGGEVSTEAMQAIAAEFQAMTSDLFFILTEKIG